LTTATRIADSLAANSGGIMKKPAALVLAATVLMGACASGPPAQGIVAAVAATGVPAPGSAFSECRNCPEMVVLPAGSFIMGTPPTEDHHRDHERQHPVTETTFSSVV
jgi:formylglycine-generating enzyme required for sulfatase activity